MCVQHAWISFCMHCEAAGIYYSQRKEPESQPHVSNKQFLQNPEWHPVTPEQRRMQHSAF